MFLPIVCLIIFFSVLKSNAQIFDTKNESSISVKDTKESLSNGYFGYSVLLQKNKNSSGLGALVVGAPKFGSFENGGIFKCQFNGQKCLSLIEINDFVRTNPSYNFSGSFLGASITGSSYSNDGKIYTCAPRSRKTRPNDILLNGICFEITFDESSTKKPVVINPFLNRPQISSDSERKAYYNHAFAELGFDIHQLESDPLELLMGVPGIAQWNGGIAVRNKENVEVLPQTIRPAKTNEQFYLGYKVSSGHFLNNSRIWYVASAPRGHQFKGQVIIFEKSPSRQDKINIRKELIGETPGSYFGGALAVGDVTGDGFDDLFVGAPTHPGETFDEGCVYFYQNLQNGQFDTELKFCNPGKTGGRFGSAISVLGDVDLDGYSDVAISAPYENDIGAVYIFMGSKFGLLLPYSQKIVPKTFTPNIVQGFGISISNGVDIDNDRHIDMAVGAHKSDQVFIFKAKMPVDYIVHIDSNNTILHYNSSELNITYCISFKFRNNQASFLNTEIKFEMDYRILTNLPDLNKTLNLRSHSSYCRNIKLVVKPSAVDFTPLKIKINYKAETFEKWETYQKSILFAHICGEDNLCQSDLSGLATSDKISIINGQDKDLTVTVNILNNKEPAFEPILYVTLPRRVDLVNLRECTALNLTKYACPLGDILTWKRNKVFNLDIKNVPKETRKLDIFFEVQSAGNDTMSSDNFFNISIPIEFKTKSKLEGNLNTEIKYYVDDSGSLKQEFQFTNNFFLHNFGPSQLHMNNNMVFYIPQFLSQNNESFKIDKIQAEVGSNIIQCEEINTGRIFLPQNSSVWNVSLPIERILEINCFNNDFCSTVRCDEFYLAANEVANFVLTIELNTNLLDNELKINYPSKNIIFYTTHAAVLNQNGSMSLSKVQTILIGPLIAVPLWIYIISILGGIIMIAIMIYVLFKFNFFKRGYKDKKQLLTITEEQSKSEEDSISKVDSNTDEPSNTEHE